MELNKQSIQVDHYHKGEQIRTQLKTIKFSNQ